jgi:dTDP-4-dehydrorhamnose 3,5-epimerase
MNVTETTIAGVFVVDLAPREDDRGYFTRVFCTKELASLGVDFSIKQINRSFSNKKGMIRGLHYQTDPFGEDKIVQCLRGKIFDVAVDLRNGSKTYGQYFTVELSEQNKRMLIVPKGCAHGFQSLSDTCTVEYFVSQFYTPEAEKGIRWNDPFFHIPWPISHAVVSQKDSAWPLYATS